jgi:hypothetical protein
MLILSIADQPFKRCSIVIIREANLCPSEVQIQETKFSKVGNLVTPAVVAIISLSKWSTSALTLSRTWMSKYKDVTHNVRYFLVTSHNAKLRFIPLITYQTCFTIHIVSCSPWWTWLLFLIFILKSIKYICAFFKF